jgi:[ribosomal protein S5]-alanine N-acetyltransferase
MFMLENINVVNWHQLALKLCQAEPNHAAMMVAYYRRNQDHLQAWEPERSTHFYQSSHWLSLLQYRQKQCLFEEAAHWIIQSPWQMEVIGCINVVPIRAGVHSTWNLGYSMDQNWQGMGIMSKMLSLVLADIGHRLQVQAVEACYQPENRISHHLLKKLGFVAAKPAVSQLEVNGCFRSHQRVVMEQPALKNLYR